MDLQMLMGIMARAASQFNWTYDNSDRGELMIHNVTISCDEGNTETVILLKLTTITTLTIDVYSNEKIVTPTVTFSSECFNNSERLTTSNPLGMAISVLTSCNITDH